jgi:hypothetical protein
MSDSSWSLETGRLRVLKVINVTNAYRTMNNFQVLNSKHFENEWLVQKLANDFLLEDVWELPIRFNSAENDSLYVFRKNAVEPVIKDILNTTLTGYLFRFRGLIGDLFGIDKRVNGLPIPGCREVSLAERITRVDKQKHKNELNIDMQRDNYLNFRTVYSFEDETLNELSNATEHSLMHWAWILEKDNIYKVQMAVMVKHRNWIGKIYMNLIRPFRHRIVYPYVLTEIVRRWNLYKRETCDHCFK